MEAWPTVPIGELFKLKQGTYLKPDDMGENQSEEFPFPVYGANGIIGYSNRKMYGERTTLVSCRGANCGVVHYTVPNVWISNNSIACVPKEDIDPAFYYYVCENTDFGDVITGSAQPQITITNLLSKEFVRPPLPVQRRIAGILSAYDELMENSQRRIRLLEAMARALYREWFVHFRFPGHALHPRVASPLGDIPQGWEFALLASLVDFAKGRKPAETRPEPLPGDVKLLLIDSLHGGKAVFTAPVKLVLAEIRDTIMVMDGASSCEVTIGSSGAVGSTLGRFRTTQPDRFSPHTLYRFLEAKAEEFKSKNIGAAIPHANKDYILAQSAPLPPKAITASFNAQIEPIQCAIETLKLQIQNLRRTRDLMLPRLLSGQLEIGNN
jgi:type I restriction enzyme S subunit